MPALAYCAQCGGELYGSEDVYRIDGEYIHDDCLPDYARERYASVLAVLAEWEGLTDQCF